MFTVDNLVDIACTDCSRLLRILAFSSEDGPSLPKKMLFSFRPNASGLNCFKLRQDSSFDNIN